RGVFASFDSWTLCGERIPWHMVVAATLVVAHWSSIRQGQALPLQLPPSSTGKCQRSKGHFRALKAYFGNL
ncbi:MAG: hypothetical protein QME81_16855, partial [bacterium]|nr:hypothetical protein [bacterium]